MLPNIKPSNVTLHLTSKFDEKLKRINTLCLNDFSLKNKKKYELWQIITDFDHTLTHPNSEMCHGMIRQLCPNEKICQIAETIHQKACIDFKSGANHSSFWHDFNNALIDHEFEKWMINDIINNTTLYLREYVKEFFLYCSQYNVPILIISAGIENIIEIFLWNEKLLLDNVKLFANRFIFEDDNHLFTTTATATTATTTTTAITTSITSPNASSLSLTRLITEHSKKDINEKNVEKKDIKVEKEIEKKIENTILVESVETKNTLEQKDNNNNNNNNNNINVNDNDQKDEIDEVISAITEEQRNSELNRSKIIRTGPVVHSYNKHEVYSLCEDYFHEHEEMNDRCLALCLGDSLHDCDAMKNIPHIKECIYVGFLKADVERLLPSYLERYDVVITEKDGSMEFALDLLRFLIDDPENSFQEKWINSTLTRKVNEVSNPTTCEDVK